MVSRNARGILVLSRNARGIFRAVGMREAYLGQSESAKLEEGKSGFERHL